MYLMKSDEKIAKIKMQCNRPVAYEEVYRKDLLPIGTYSENTMQQQLLLNAWWKSRSIPAVRPNLYLLEERTGKTVSELIRDSLGLSLTDTYWISDHPEDYSWKEINYHQNGFDPVMMNLYMNTFLSAGKSPDYTTDGVLTKMWMENNSRPVLYKTADDYVQRPSGSLNADKRVLANEVIYSQVAAWAGVDVTPYQQHKEFVYCPCFIANDHSDYITAMQVKHEDMLSAQGLLQKLVQLGLETPIRQMLTLDCLFHNTDRHEKNFGLIRDAGDQSIRMAPLFDHGYCLGAGYTEYVKVTDIRDMKPLLESREVMLQQYGIPMSLPTESELVDLIKNTYQDFQIDGWRLKLAIDEMEYGLECLSDHDLIQTKEQETER